MVPLGGKLSDWPEIQSFLEEDADHGQGKIRAGVLLSSAMIESVLQRMLLRFLADTHKSEELLVGAGAPLGTFSSRILAAQAFGLISAQEASCLDLIRKVRNEYAHKMSFAVNSDSISDRVRNLSSKMPYGLDGIYNVGINAERNFRNCVVGLAGILTCRFDMVDDKRCVPFDFIADVKAAID